MKLKMNINRKINLLIIKTLFKRRRNIMKPIVISLFIVVFGFVSVVTAKENIIVMGYKDKSKPPLIGEKNDNSGLYKDLFEKAANQMGCKLKIVRQPKKRIHIGLKNGSIDFYPGASFSKKRAEYLFYLPNGLQTKEVLLSLNNHTEINDISKVKGRLIIELGSSKINWDIKYPGLQIIQMGKLPIDKVIIILKKGRGDFFIGDIEPVDYYKKISNINKYTDIGIKVHHNAISNEYIAMNLGFSRKSPLFKEEPNPNFDPPMPIALDNIPTKINEECVAYKFYLELVKLKGSGETQKIYDKYFK